MISTILLALFAISLGLMVAGSFLSFRSQRKASSSSREGISTYTGGTLRGGARVYTPVDTLTKSPAALRSTATLTKSSARLKAPAMGYRYEVYREETLFSRILPHLNLVQLIKPRAGQPTPWLGVVLISVALFGFCYSALGPILNHSSSGTFFLPLSIPDTAPTTTQNTTTKATTQSPFIGVAGISQSLMRLNQMSTTQYASSSEYGTWAASACSAAAMTEIINAYSHKNYHVSDILKVESGLHQITPQDGLLQPQGIGITVAQFGFNATYLQNPTLSSIEQIANAGHPVIISFPPSNWPGGHILILRGGTGDKVYLADSSVLDMQVMASDKFLSYWGGFAVVVVPDK